MTGEAPKKRPGEESLPSGLGARERWLAGLIGLLGVSTGGVGIFLSNNQAGTTAILLLGAVFLLMGVQGTAIIKASKDSVELERRRAVARELTDKAQELVEEKEPEAAAELVKAARVVNPSNENDSTLRRIDGRIYELEVFEAVGRALVTLRDEGSLNRLGEIVSVLNPRVAIDRHQFDIGIESAHSIGPIVGIEVKGYAGPLPVRVVRTLLDQLDKSRTKSLLVTRSGLLPSAEKELQRARATIRAVQWATEEDDEKIVEALRTLLESSNK